MGAPFIPPVSAREPADTKKKETDASGGRTTPGISLDVQLPASGSSVDDKTAFDVSYLAHEQLEIACQVVRHRVEPHATGGRLVLLDASLRRGLELYAVAILQLRAAVARFAEVTAKAEAELAWWREATGTDTESSALTESAASRGAGLVTNLLALAANSAKLVGREVKISEMALYCALAGAFTSPNRRVTLYAPSIFGPWGEPVFSDGVPRAFPNSLQEALEAAFRGSIRGAREGRRVRPHRRHRLRRRVSRVRRE